jgi:hypothetical protein
MRQPIFAAMICVAVAATAGTTSCPADAQPSDARSSDATPSDAKLFEAEPSGTKPFEAELFVDFGAQLSRVSSKIANRDAKIDDRSASLHLGIGARRSLGDRSDLAVRLEADDIDGDLLLALRALDFRRHISDHLAWTGFLGVARLDLATPAYGWYLGGGVQFKDLMPSWDLGVDIRYGDRLARDNVLPSDPQGGSPDNFHSVYGVSVYLSYRF